MTIATRKFPKSPRRVARKSRVPARKRPAGALEAQQMTRRIDEMISELQTFRRQLNPPIPVAPPNIVDQLFGALGHGTWEEYDLDLEWKRFSEWNHR